MPNNDEKGKLDARVLGGMIKKPFHKLKRSGCLAQILIFMASLVALVAIVALILWSVVTFYVPFHLYSIETESKKLTNGQTLRVVYPNLILGDDKPAEMLLILTGTPNGDKATFTVDIPAGLTVRAPKSQAYATKLELESSGSGSDTEPEEIRISLVNSRSAHGPDLLVRKRIEITSPQLERVVPVDIGVETIRWIAAQAIINNPANEKNALILFIASLVSGAGTLILQHLKTQDERSRENREKREKQFRDDLDKNPVDVLDGFSRLKSDELEDSDFSIKKPVVETFGWEDKLQQMILDRLKSRDHHFDAKRAAEVLDRVCGVFTRKDQPDNFRHSQLFAPFCKLLCEDDRKTHPLTAEEAQCLLDVSKRWHELKPLAADMIHDFAVRRENMSVINQHLASNEDGQQLLRKANIHDVIQDHRIKFPNDANATRIYETLIPDTHWRKTEWGRERKLSDRTLRWLFACFSDPVDTEFSLGSEYAELEDRKKHSALELPVFGRIKNSDAVIVFGGEGTGKTAAALWLLDQYQEPASAGIFPVYAPYEAAVELKEWIVGTIARALINFTADNPRKFMISPESRRTTMGRLMLWHARSLEALRLNLYSSKSEHNNAADVEQVMEYLKMLKLPKTQAKLTKDEMLSSLYLAYPDGFEQIWFLWDIPASSPQEDVVSRLKEMMSLAAPLSRQNVIVKIFAPLSAKKDDVVNHLGGIRHAGDLAWDDDQLMDLLSKKIKDKFKNLWDISMRDPISGLLVQAAERSPRRLMKLLWRLIDHVDSRNLQDGEPLNQNDFDQWLPGPAGKK